MRVQPLFTFGKIDNIQGARVWGEGRFLWIFVSIYLEARQEIREVVGGRGWDWTAKGGGMQKDKTHLSKKVS
jgi:hypothetical protein